MSHNIEDAQFGDGNVSIQYAKVSMLIEYFKAAMCSALPQTAHRSILNDGTACEEKSSMVQLYAKTETILGTMRQIACFGKACTKFAHSNAVFKRLST